MLRPRLRRFVGAAAAGKRLTGFGFWLSLLAMHLCRSIRRDFAGRGEELIPEGTRHHVGVSGQQRFYPLMCNFGGVILLALPDFSPVHARAWKKLVSVGPGIRVVIFTFVSFSSLRKASANDVRNAFDAP